METTLGGNGRRVRVEFHLTVPRGAYLDEIETVNGSVTVSNMNNFTKVSAVNGGVKAVNLSGTAELSTVNGKTEAEFENLKTTDKISLETVNGTVNLILPSDINAVVRASTVNGRIENDFGLPVKKGKYVGRDLYGRIGGGGVEVKLDAVNGTLNIKHKNDGKNINPATNLLNMSSSSDDDDSGSKENAEINKEIAQAQRDAEKEQRKAQREVEKELKNAQREMEKIQPMINDIISNTVSATTSITNEQVQRAVNAQNAREKEKNARNRNANFTGIPNVSQQTETFTIKDKTKIKIAATDCAIDIRGWDKPEIRYVLTEFATGNNKTGNVQAEQKGANFNISVINDEGKSDDDYNGMRLEIFVPKKSDLTIETEGEIRLEGVSGEIDLKGDDGNVDVRNSGGNLVVNVSAGRIRVVGFQGGITAESADGDVMLEGKFDKLTAKTVDGNVILTIPSETGAIVTADRDIETENIKMTADGDKKWRVGDGSAKYNLSAVDGKLIVRGMKEIVY